MRSSYCNFGDCLDAEYLDGQVWVRNTRVPEAALVFEREEWDAFLAGVRAGEFDMPARDA